MTPHPSSTDATLTARRDQEGMAGHLIDLRISRERLQYARAERALLEAEIGRLRRMIRDLQPATPLDPPPPVARVRRPHAPAEPDRKRRRW